VKQLQVRDEGAGDEAATRLVPVLREYTVFKTSINAKTFPMPSRQESRCAFAIPARGMNWPTSSCVPTGADIREGHGEAYFVPSHDFVFMPAFEAVQGRGPILQCRLPRAHALDPAINRGSIAI
jgi:antirestriction protein ArdC